MSPRQPAKRKLAKRNRKRLKEGIHLPTKGKAHRVWDTEQKGLYVNVQRSGTRSYRVIYRLGEQKREHSLQLGRFDEMHIDEARDRAREVRRAAAAGIDPTAKPVEPPNPFTFGDCIDKWIDYCQQGPSAGRTQKFMHSAFASWHGRLLSSLSYPEIEDFLHAYRKRAPQSANRLHAHLKAMLRWAVRSKRLDANPALDMPKPAAPSEPRERAWFEGKRVDEFIKAYWRAADQLGGDVGRFMKLLLITGKRCTAIKTMRWETIDDDWYWRPTIGNKTKRCHSIPLPKLAQRILSPRLDTGRVLATIWEQPLGKQVKRMIGVDDFLWHGVRYLVETKLGEDLDVPPHIRDMLFDHKPKRGAGTGYDIGKYRAQCLAALENWCAHIERLVSPAEGVAVLR